MPSCQAVLRIIWGKLQNESSTNLRTYSIYTFIYCRHSIYCSTSSDFRSWQNQHSAPSSVASWRRLLLFLEVVQLWQIYAMRTLLRLWLLMVCTASHKFVEGVIYIALYDDGDGDWAWREPLLQHNEPRGSAMVTSMGMYLNVTCCFQDVLSGQ